MIFGWQNLFYIVYRSNIYSLHSQKI